MFPNNLSTLFLPLLLLLLLLKQTTATVTVTATATATATATCYARNGSSVSPDFQPYSTDPSNPLSRICCHNESYCLPNGLCSARRGPIWVEFCTLKNWDQGGCQDLCSVTNGIVHTENQKVTPCDGKGNTSSIAWCCGNTDLCCSPGNPSRHLIAARFGDPIPMEDSSDVPHNKSGGRLSKGGVVGIGVGVGLAVVVLVGVGIFLGRARQKKKKAAAKLARSDGHAETYAKFYKHQVDADLLVQLPGIESEVYEMSSRQNLRTGQDLPELPGCAPSANDLNNVTRHAR